MLGQESNKMTTENKTCVSISSDMAAFSKQLNHLIESIDLLYIKNNASGRKIFRNKWPEVAEYLFGVELTNYDMCGVKNDEDRAHRSKMEDEADIRRIELKQTINEIVEKSVDSGVLQFEYVGFIIDKYGVSLSKFLYEESVIKRVRPELLSKSEETDDSLDTKQSTVVDTQKKRGAQQSKTDNICLQEYEQNPENDRLSKEETEILSNKEFTNNITESLPELPLIQEDLLDCAHSIKTPMSQTTMRKESSQNIHYEDELISTEKQINKKNTEILNDKTKVSLEKQQIESAKTVKEILVSDTRSLIIPELLDFGEAIAAQGVPKDAELLLDEILQEEHLLHHIEREKE